MEIKKLEEDKQKSLGNSIDTKTSFDINILQKLKKDLELINKYGIINNEALFPKDIQTVLKEKEGNNIMEYIKYINSVLEISEIDELIKIFKEEEKEEIYKFQNSIIKYEKYFFEEEFIKVRKKVFLIIPNPQSPMILDIILKIK